jgi:cell wall-associated NlpC family hydrolase
VTIAGRIPLWGGRGLLIAGMIAVPASLPAQGVGVGWYSGSQASYFIFSAGVTRPVAASVSTTISGSWYQSQDGGGGLLGAGLDLNFWRGGRPGLYAVAGVGGGFGFSGADAFWASYSIGAGYDFRLFSAVGLGVEARWQGLTEGADEGVQVSVRLGGGMRRKSSAPAPTTPAASSAAAVAAPAGLSGTPVAMAVVETALGAMGTPYSWGGSSSNGFDCSGLIQYAYRAHGIALPRTSADQAKQGAVVERELSQLAPGDILTFSSGAGGDKVSHVGLYLGGGEFIHSATNGVQKSVLSATDPYGKWWWERWVGARRVVPA